MYFTFMLYFYCMANRPNKLYTRCVMYRESKVLKTRLVMIKICAFKLNFCIVSYLFRIT